MSDSNDDFPEIGTKEWGEMNRRRAELIRKKNRQGLDSEEQSEYERLQRLSRDALAKTFPEPSLHEEEIAKLMEEYGVTGKPSSE